MVQRLDFIVQDVTVERAELMERICWFVHKSLELLESVDGLVSLYSRFFASMNFSDSELVSVLKSISKISSGSHVQTVSVALISLHIVPFLENPNPVVREHSILILGNLVAEAENFKALLISHGILQYIAKIIAEDLNGDIVATAVWTLCSLARGQNADIASIFNSGLFGVLVERLRKSLDITEGSHMSDREVTIATEISWVMSFLTAHEIEYVNDLLSKHLIDLSKKATKIALGADFLLDLAIPALRAIGNVALAYSSEFVVSLLQDAAFMNCLLGALNQGENHNLVREAIWSASTLITSTQAIQLLVSYQILERIFQLVNGAPTADIFIDSMTFVFRLAKFYVMQNQISDFVHFITLNDGLIAKNVVELLHIRDYDSLMLGINFSSLIMQKFPESKGVYYMEERGVIDGLEFAREFNDECYDLCEGLMDTYFGESYGQ
jgi:hypothetical protein